jgi:methionyl-tRNA formyltransferase
MLEPLRPDVILTTVFPWRIPQDVIDLPRLGAINVHPSLLPKYRGTMTPNWTLLNGETAGGMTAHRMVADFDAGPILAQVTAVIHDDDTIETYARRLFEQAPQLLAKAFARVTAGDPGDPQDESEATYFGHLPEDLRVIDWHDPARTIHNKVRGFSGFVSPPGAIGVIDGVPSRITRSRLLPGGGAAAVAPGTVLARTDEGTVVQCGDGPLLVVEQAPA